RRARELGARVELIAPTDVKTLVPQVNVDDVAVATYEAESGYADPSSTANALINRARELGAVIVQYHHVEALRTSGSRVIGVRTETGDVAAPVVVNCGGLWAARLLAPLGIDVPIAPTRHQMCFFRRPRDFKQHPAIGDPSRMTYMRPEHGDL